MYVIKIYELRFLMFYLIRFLKLLYKTFLDLFSVLVVDFLLVDFFFIQHIYNKNKKK